MEKSTARADALERLEQGIGELVESERWATWLGTAAKFHRYSFGNTLLIALQRPDATQVAGFRRWLELGRHVRKGEHGIAILAPCPQRRKVTETGDDGTETTRTVELHSDDGRMFFRTAYVFDVSQTDGEELPEHPAQLLEGEGPAGAWEHLLEVAQAHGLAVSGEPADGPNGYYMADARRIVVESDRCPAQQVKTLAHELGHALLGHGGSFGECRGLVELEAESVAFVVCATLGLDTSGYSLGYVASWAGGGKEAIAALKTSAGRILEAARAIAGDLEPAQDVAA